MSVFSRALSTIKNEGIGSTAWRTGKWISGRNNPFAEKPLQTVFKQDVIAADWTKKRKFAAQPLISADGRPQIAWIISPPSASSGGHQNAFRFMKYLEEAGYDLTIYLYSATKYPKVSVAGIREMLQRSSAYPDLAARFVVYDPEMGVTGAYDAVVASDWATAYAAWRYQSDVPRLYWVQDFEPYFFARNSDYVVAENSYRLGFQGVAIGPWLALKLRRDYGMPCEYYEYSVDSSLYKRTNDNRRSEVLFYVRPETGRRATEFGLLVAEELHNRRPDISIHMAGSSSKDVLLPFEVNNHGVLDISQLPDVYNSCAAVVTFSLTCASLLGLEAMACGAVPIINDGENTQITLHKNPGVVFLPMSVSVFVDRIIEIVDNSNQVEKSRAIAKSIAGQSWAESGDVVVSFFEKVLNRKK